MERIPTAREIMYSPSRIMHPDMDIYGAMRVLHTRDSAAAIVKDEQGKVVGILTEKDCLRVLSVDIYDGAGVLTAGKVRDYMSPVKVLLSPEMDLFTIADAFLQTNFTCLPVLDNEKLVGCVCRRRMLAAITTLQQQTDAHRATALELNKLVTRLEGAPLARILVLRNKPHSPLYRV